MIYRIANQEIDFSLAATFYIKPIVEQDSVRYDIWLQDHEFKHRMFAFANTQQEAEGFITGLRLGLSQLSENMLEAEAGDVVSAKFDIVARGLKEGFKATVISAKMIESELYYTLKGVDGSDIVNSLSIYWRVVK